MEMLYFGLEKSPRDDRDMLLDTFVPRTPPSRYTIPDMPPVKQQGPEGSCAGQAGSSVKEWQEKLDLGKPIQLSARFLYEEAKKISGHREGTTLKAIMQVLAKKGICTEEEWRYLPKVVGEPKDGAYDTAKNFKVANYARVRNLDYLKRSLIKYGPTLIGVLVYRGMVNSRKTGVVPNPKRFLWFKERPLGGHAVVAYEYMDKSPYFKNDGHVKCHGSWGKSFGEKGSHIFSYRYIKEEMLDAMSCVDELGSQPPMRVAHLTEEERDKSWV